MREVATLTLRETLRAGGAGKTECLYFDFFISDMRLVDLLGWGANFDMVTPLGWGPIEFQKNNVAELVLKQQPFLPTGRCLLYICPECGSMGCGAITVHIEQEDEFIVWRDFGYEHDWEDDLHLDKFAAVGPLYFKQDSYLQTLNSFQPREMVKKTTITKIGSNRA